MSPDPLIPSSPQSTSEPAPEALPFQAQPDPLAHRRAEPRLFAFLWTIYLLAAVAGSVLWLAQTSVVAASAYGPAARIMLVVIAVGATILWPMTRLSQALPEHDPVGACLADLFVVLGPVQVILWPLLFLASWPVDVIGSLALMFAGWTALSGALLALALGGRSGGESAGPSAFARAAWMILLLTLVGGAPVLVAVANAAGFSRPARLDLASPFTSVYALTGRGFSGPPAPVSDAQWYALAAVALAAVALWAAAWARQGTPAVATAAGR